MWLAKKVYYFANVRDEVSLPASGVSSCGCKNHDRSPEGTGISSIAPLAPISEYQNPNAVLRDYVEPDLKLLVVRVYPLASDMLLDMECERMFWAWVRSFPSQAAAKELLSLWKQAGCPQIEWPDGKWEFDRVLEEIRRSFCDGVFLANVPDDRSPLAFGTKGCSAADVPKVPQAW